MKIKIITIRPPRLAMMYLLLALVIYFLSPAGTLLHIPSIVLAIIIFVAGFMVMMWAWGLFQKEKTEVCPLSEANKTLITRGPYSFSRNPQYLGMVFMLAGVAFLFGSVPMFLAPVAFFITINNVFIPYEESKMLKQYGNKFEAYRTKVRMWL
ncbi:MAG: methyltransferase family protein [Bacteroidota bacterium]